jgi:dipeptidyl aminopeptidase/acylaminoacyl peptidase
MKKFFGIVCVTLILTACTGRTDVAPAGGSPVEIPGVRIVTVQKTVGITSKRGTEIPAIVTIPGGNEKYPVVIMAHGHGGNKDVAGGFTDLAKTLAARGIASLRLDFPGCGDSKESFIEGNRVSYMVDDVRSCKEYLAKETNIDLTRLGILGYSMGGRAAAITIADDSAYKTAVFWSPAISKGSADLYTFMQLNGEDDYNKLYAEAKANGQASFTTIFGRPHTLGVGWFDDMAAIEPLARISAYKGDILLITGGKDNIIPPQAARQLTAAAKSAKSIKETEIAESDHNYGFYTRIPELAQKTVNETAAFFAETL